MATLNGRTRKILAMNGCLHTGSNITRLFLPRNKGGRGGLIEIKECSGRKKISLWLSKEEHIVDAASGIIGKGDCLRREPPGF